MKNREIIRKSLLWDITRKCNLNCAHCYNSGNIADSFGMNVSEDYKKIIVASKNLGINHIHLLGGEPLLVRGLYDLIEYARFKDILITINTNGTLLTVATINKIIESKVSQITISLDGANAGDNDIIRGDGTFDLILKNMGKLTNALSQIESDMIVQVATVITKQNINSILKMPLILKSMGVNNLNILSLYECGNATINEGILQISHEEYIEVLSKLLLESYRNKMFLQIDCKPKVLEKLSNKYGFNVELNSDFNGCSAVRKTLYMDCDGYIYPCGPIAHSCKDKMPTSDLRTHIFEEKILNYLDKFKQRIEGNLKSFISPSSQCLSCNYVSQCSGCAICYNGYENLCEVACRLM